MAAVKLTATLKSPRETMTILTLGAALDELVAVADVPVDAILTVVHYQQGGWELTAKWMPEPAVKPEEPAVKVAPGWGIDVKPSTFLTEEQLAETARGIRDSRDFRKLKDNPQA